MSSKAECPACKSYLSAVYDAMHGDTAAPCPSCGLPASALREIEQARKAHADAALTAKLEAALIRAGKAEAALAALRRRAYQAREVFADWERDDPFGSEKWRRAPDWDDD